jgi:prephenate dehydratase
MKVGCLGPRGAFSEKAAHELVPEADEFLLYKNIADVLTDVQNGVLDEGVVPIQNSTEGAVNVTIDSLIFDVNLYIQKQLVLPVRHALLIAPKNALRLSGTPIIAPKNDLRLSGTPIIAPKNASRLSGFPQKILSHPQALAQCRAYLKENYPDAELIETASTSDAAKITAGSDSPCACVASDICAEIYGLKILDNDIQDSDQNKTYFILLSKKETPPVKDKKISLAFSTANKPGELYRILSVFMIEDINITQIISRPMRGRIDEYVFFIDIEVLDERDVLDAFAMLRRKTNFFKFLGCYDRTQ